MRVVMLVNPVSGRGRAKRSAQETRAALDAAGIEVDVVPTPEDGSEVALSTCLPGAAVVVAVGGDGTMRLAAAAAIQQDTPLWHLPCGTANLFARAMGTSGDPAQLLAALEAGQVDRVDVGEANGELFVLMVSIGYDAEIVHEVTGRRGSTTSNRSYLGPMIRQFGRWQPAELSIAADGNPMVTPEQDGPGTLVVANCSQYMWGLDPARDAIMDDQLLDAVFFPVRSRAELLRWMTRCARGSHLRHPASRSARATEFEITCASPQRLQLDGDPPGNPSPVAHLLVRVRAGVLPVLRAVSATTAAC